MRAATLAGHCPPLWDDRPFANGHSELVETPSRSPVVKEVLHRHFLMRAAKEPTGRVHSWRQAIAQAWFR